MILLITQPMKPKKSYYNNKNKVRFIKNIFKENDYKEILKENMEQEEKYMQPAVSTALQAILADRGYKVLEIKTFSGATFVGTNIQIKFNDFLLTNCVYCNDELFSTIQNISEVRILFFS